MAVIFILRNNCINIFTIRLLFIPVINLFNIDVAVIFTLRNNCINIFTIRLLFIPVINLFNIDGGYNIYFKK